MLKLSRVRVTKYRSIDDSGWVDVDDVTCLVGKNESGKTAFLQALSRLNPVLGVDGDFDPVIDYPSKDYGRYRKHHDTNPDVVVSAEFEVSDALIGEIEEQFGKGVLTSGSAVEWSKNYANRRIWAFSTDDAKVVKQLVRKCKFGEPVAAEAKAIDSIAKLSEFIAGLSEPSPAVEQVREFIESWPGGSYRSQIAVMFEASAPEFFYFDDYSVMRGRVAVQHLQGKVATDDLDDADRTFLALLALGGADLDDFENEVNFERLTRELEAAANAIGAEVFEFWTQNQALRVNVQVSQANPADDPPLNSGSILNVRIFNERHGVTVPFDERSRGFVWFFSFFAYFSELDAEPGSIVLLLDEPGLSLHAKAQDDFLNFIEKKLAPDFQVVYSTHSPFLIDASHLDRVRTVQDVDGEGTRVSSDIYRTDHDTVFPLQAALGYELAQTLFLGPNCLLVEGPSDLIYLQVLGEAVLAAGGEALDPRWVVVPVGGADKISTFVTLVGANQLNVAVLIDVDAKDRQRIDNLQENGHLDSNALVQISDITKTKSADIEDLFEVDFYLDLVNDAYALKPRIKEADLDKNPRVVKSLDAYFAANNLSGGRLNHYRPAALLQRKQGELLEKLSGQTVENATELFKTLNALLPE